MFLSPYRCRDCRTRFWVIGRNAHHLAGMIGISIAAIVILWNVATWPEAPRSDRAEAEAGSGRLGDLTKLAEKGDAAAELELAGMYEKGVGVDRNALQEFKWLERSAKHGNVQAQYQLAVALRDGRDTIQDFVAASKWMTRAAEGGSGQAQLAIGNMYRLGLGLPIDNIKAYVWLNVAASQGVSGASTSRDALLSRLASNELLEAQSEARRLSAIYGAKAVSTD
jgi:TPR repeat protein